MGVVFGSCYHVKLLETIGKTRLDIFFERLATEARNFFVAILARMFKHQCASYKKAWGETILS